MRTASIAVAAFTLGAATLAMTRDAHALGPVDVEVGARVGLATSPASTASSNPLGFGLGARGGVDFLGFYGGVQFMYYFGGTDHLAAFCSAVPGTPCGASAFSTHTLMYGIEAGYGIPLIDVLTIRPQIGLGDAIFSSSASGPGVANPGSRGSNGNLYLEPGVTGLFSPGGWFVGADANLLFFPAMNDSRASFSLHGQVGLKF
jgi:hypothetical protein